MVLCHLRQIVLLRYTITLSGIHQTYVEAEVKDPPRVGGVRKTHTKLIEVRISALPN